MMQRKALEVKKKLLCKKPVVSKMHKVGIVCSKKSIIGYVRKWGTSMNNACTSDKAKSSAMERASKVQANLESKFPSFVKPMLKSHVTGGFWLSFPKPFCDQHLPNHDDTVVLVDENEEEYDTKYLIDKNGLSGGWRGFSIAHKLLEGDVLIFQLIEHCKFKVYIVRVNDLTEIDGAMVLLTFDAHAKPINIGEKCPELLPPDSQKDNNREQDVMVLATDCGPAVDQLEDDSNEFESGVLDGIRFSESLVQFKDIRSIDSFSILVDGLNFDSEIPRHHRAKYYELCRSQQSLLHKHVLKGLNFKLVAGIISETVNIADAIRASKLTTSQNDYEIWDKTLKVFEALGMTVGFLRARLNRLVTLSSGTQQVIESKRLEQIQAEEEGKVLGAKLSDVKDRIQALDIEIEALKVKDRQHELMFQEGAYVPGRS